MKIRISDQLIYFTFSLFLFGLVFHQFVYSAETEIVPPKGPLYILAEFHENIGCPANSLCDKKMGLYRKKWLDFIKQLEGQSAKSSAERAKAIENYRMKFGLPVGLWSTIAAQKIYNPVLWDSSCRQHQNKNPLLSIMLGEAFIKDTKDKQIKVVGPVKNTQLPLADKNLILDQILLQEEKKSQEINAYFVPQGEVPGQMRNMNLQFIRDAEGLYYTLQISKSGEWKILPVPDRPTVSSEATDMKCPDTLEKYFKEKINHHHFYAGHFCRKISDLGSKKEYVMLVPWSCP